MNKKSKLSMNLLLIAFALLPLVISIVVSTIISYSSTKKNLESQTKQSLIVASTGLKEYYENVLAGGNEIEYSHDYTDSLQSEEIELTLFNQDIRFSTSIKDDKGDRIEGTAASEAVWKAVSGGENYYSDDVKINNKPYYVYYMPIYYPNGDLYGMAFAGKTCADVTAAKNSILLSSIISAILLIVAFGVVAVVLARKISVPINIVAKNVEKIGKGDLSDKDSVKSSITETEMLISSADVLQNELGKVISETREISDVLVEKIADVSNLINNTSENTEQISNAMNDLADGTMALAGNVQDLNLQVEKLGDCINDINDSVNVLAESSDTIKSSNDVALDYMDKVSGSSEKSVQSIDDIAQQIYETNKAIIKIDEAVGLITSVASQTNLLALNASIEAARAGEAGKGFAVVASEIQKLSEESNNGANQIKSIVQDIKKQSDASVHLSDEVKEIIAEEQGYIVETQNKFDLLNNEVTKSLQQISAIKSKTEILMDIKSQIVNNVNDLSAISEENAASNEEVSASLTSIAESVKTIAANGEEMNGCATELQESISYFN